MDDDSFFLKGQPVHKCSFKMNIEYIHLHTIQDPTNGGG